MSGKCQIKDLGLGVSDEDIEELRYNYWHVIPKDPNYRWYSMEVCRDIYDLFPDNTKNLNKTTISTKEEKNE